MEIKNWILEVAKFLTSLTTRGIIILLFSIIIGASAYRLRELESEIKQQDIDHNNNTIRYNRIIDTLEAQVKDCNKKRIDDSQESNKYWREKVDKLEKEVSDSYKEIRQNRR